MKNFLEAFVFILPVILAGATFIFFIKKEWFNFLNHPIDCNLSFGNKRVLGENKTWRGPAMFPVFTLFYAWVLTLALKKTPMTVYWDVASLIGVTKVLLLGLSYPLAELPNSFLKRREGINPGSRTRQPFFIVADNLDSVIGVIISAWLFFRLPSILLAWMLAQGSLVHFSTDILMKHLKMKK